ncbi:MAG: hypothetical protein AAFX90_18350 [Pseudomonadota bacterium]
MLKTLVVAGSLMAIAGAAQAASKTSFGCGYASPFGGDAYKKFDAKNAHNASASNLLRHYTVIWQEQEVARICEAYGRGEPAEFGCLIDRRDYDAILAMMPENYKSLGLIELNNWAATRDVSLAQETRKYKNLAHNACVKAGARKGKLKEVN